MTICQKSQEPGFWEVIDSFILLAYASLAASRTLLERLLAYLNFTLDSEDLFCWYKWKKRFLWSMAAAQEAEDHKDKWELTAKLRWGIYTSIPIWTHSQNSLAVAAEALSLIFPWNISQMITKTIPISTRLVIRYPMKGGILLWIWWKVNGNNNMIKIFQWRESHCRTNTSIRRIKSKRAGLWESQFKIWVGKLTIWVRLFDEMLMLAQKILDLER